MNLTKEEIKILIDLVNAMQNQMLNRLSEHSKALNLFNHGEFTTETSSAWIKETLEEFKSLSELKKKLKEIK